MKPETRKNNLPEDGHKRNSSRTFKSDLFSRINLKILAVAFIISAIKMSSASSDLFAVITGPSNSVYVGSTLQLTTSTTSGYWSSSNTSVATIDQSGLVSGISAGSIVIYYSSPFGLGTYNVYVYPVITGPSHTVSVGSTLQLSSGTTIGYWASNNTTVATVSSTGLVTGKKVGSAVIRYVLSFGSSTFSVNVISTPTYNVFSPCGTGLTTATPYSGTTISESDRSWVRTFAPGNIVLDGRGGYVCTDYTWGMAQNPGYRFGQQMSKMDGSSSGDGSYVYGSANDHVIVYYSAVHWAIKASEVKQFNPPYLANYSIYQLGSLYISKWSTGPLVMHPLEGTPYGTNISYYYKRGVCNTLRSASEENNLTDKNIEDILNQDNLETIVSVMPNPSSDIFNIITGNLSGEQNVYEIYNYLGKKIQSGVLNGNNTSVNLTGNEKGLYILRLNIDGRIYHEKIVLK